MISQRGVARVGDDSSWLLAFSDLVLLLLVFLLFGLALARQPGVVKPKEAAPIERTKRLSLTQLVEPVNIVPPLPGGLASRRGIHGARAITLPKSATESRQGGKSVPAKLARKPLPAALEAPGEPQAEPLPTRVKQPLGAELQVVSADAGKANDYVDLAPAAGDAGMAAADVHRPVARDATDAIPEPDSPLAHERPYGDGSGKVVQASLGASEPLSIELPHKGEQPEEVLITLLDTVGFASGSADLLPGAMPLLDEVRSFALSHPEMAIEISGHTDNVPISSARYPSNWELASARALAVAHFLLSAGELEPCRVSARGYGEYRPVAPNLSAEGRAKNRRVEIRFYRSGSDCSVEAATGESHS